MELTPQSGNTDIENVLRGLMKIVSVYRVEMPLTVNGCAVKMCNNYVVLLNSANCERQDCETFLHEMAHIYYNDFDSDKDAGVIEAEAHARQDIFSETMKDNRTLRMIADIIDAATA